MHTVHQPPDNPAPPRCRPRVRYWRASVAKLPLPDWDAIDAQEERLGLPPWPLPL